MFMFGLRVWLKEDLGPLYCQKCDAVASFKDEICGAGSHGLCEGGERDNVPADPCVDADEGL